MKKRVLAWCIILIFLLIPMNTLAAESSSAETQETDDKSSGFLPESGFTLDYIFIDQKEVNLGENQKIVVHLNEDISSITQAHLIINSGDKAIEVPAEVWVNGYIQFTITSDILSAEGEYRVGSVGIHCGEEIYPVDFGMDEIVTFSVVENTDVSLLSEDELGASVIMVQDELTSDDVAAAIEASGLNNGISMMSESGGNMVIVLDPGHDKTHAGAVNAATGVIEQNANLAIALACREELEKYKGVDVYMTRESENCAFNAPSSSKCLIARTDFAKSVGADLFVSFHNNVAGNGQLTSANGSEVYISGYSKYKNMTSEISKLIQTELKDNLGLNIRNFGGIVNTTDGWYDDGTRCDALTVIRNSVLNGFPGILIEHAFINNASDAALLKNPSALKLMGKSDALAIAKYFGLQVSDGGDNDSPVTYQVHVQTEGWQNWRAEGQEAGTVGLAKRLEGIRIKINKSPDLGVRYKTHVQTYGWQDWVSNGALSGTTGEAKRLEAIQIELTGADKDNYDIYYRVHAQTYGWLDWAKNGEPAGTSGYAKRLESIQIVLKEKGAPAPGNTDNPYIALPAGVQYMTHVQTFGWQNWVTNGAVSGTEGKAKRLEGIKIQLVNPAYSGGISYRTHVQTYGWQDWAANGIMSGTEGLAKRLEAIEIKLTGDIAAKCDIYYRVHAQTFGWLDWAKNGEPAGSAGYAKRLEGIQIVVQPKQMAAPGPTDQCFYEK